VDDQRYYQRLVEMLEGTYLAASDARAQSGFSGDAARWERGRRVITAPMTSDGDFLDIGCANGHLMETVATWAAAAGVTVEPYGLDLSPRLAELAASRLPHWADRIWVGNVATWDPPRRFDYVRTELGYVPEHLRPDLVQRLLDDYLEPGGIAILCSYGSVRGSPASDIAGLARSWGFDVAGEDAATDVGDVVITRVCWIRAAALSSPMPPG
jgi:SAM-dependent methyltransferase